MVRYDSYKESGVEWIGEVPELWNPIKLKYIGFLFGGLSGKSGKDFKQDDNPNNKPYIPFTNISDNTYISQDNLGRVVILDEEDQNVVKQFDLFFLMSSETQEDVGKSSVLKDNIGEVYLNSFCRGFRIINEKFDPLFINYLLSGHSYRELLSVEGKGFTRINLRSHKITDLIVYYPPLTEQQQIVEFLDQKTSIIDDLIQKKLRKIELLKEQRNSIINHTVTKGLNPDVKMKDSGVEWIGEIPMDWNVGKLKFLSNIKRGSSPRPIDDSKYFDENGEYHWIRISDLTKSGRRLYSTEQKLSELGSSLSYKLDPDELVMSISGSVGKVIITKTKCCIHDGFVVFQGLKPNRDYLYYILTNPDLYGEDGKLGTQFNINSDIVGNKFIPILSNSEQHQIVQYLDQKTTEIDTQISLENKKIDLLKEYRQSLISEVVTGKIDVRKN